MISLICTHCQTELSIDDAFAGGVCRCQHCGTIQTVPAKRTDATAAGTASIDPGSGRSLYQTQTREPRTVNPTSAGLEELADIVASSGLGGSGLSGSGLSGGSLRKKKPARPAAADVAPTPNRTPLMIGIGALLAVGIGAAIWFAMRPASTPPQATPQENAVSPQANGQGASPPGDGTPAVTSVAGPQFCGMPITGSSVVYLLDRGDSAGQLFDALKQATYASIATLGAERKFQVSFWDNHTGDASYPPSEPTYATSENLSACTKALDDVTAFHQSDIIAPLKKAVSENPDVIIIATAKGFELDDSFVEAVQAIIKGSSVKLDTISLHGSDCPPLQRLAKESGGTYKSVSDGILRNAAPQ